MEIVLHLLAERTRPDNAEIELGVLQHPAAGLLQEARAGIEPSCIRPVVRIGRPDRQIFGVKMLWPRKMAVRRVPSSWKTGATLPTILNASSHRPSDDSVSPRRS